MGKIKREKGFTLLEVLISAVLIIIGVGSIGFTVVSVRRFFNDNEDRARAMRLASSKIDEFLAKGYSGAQAPSSSSDQEDGFSWSLNIYAETATGIKDGTAYRIPYKKAEVAVSYTADKGKGGINSVRNIHLTNIIPYPIMHAASVNLGAATSVDAEVPHVKADESDPFSKASVAGPEDTDKEGDGAYLKLENLQYNVKKDIQVIYSIALNVYDTNGEIRSTDTVYTACFLDGEQVGLVSRTPLSIQPSFSNSLVFEDVKKDIEHTIEVRWYYANMYKKDGVTYDSEYNNAKISLREAVLTVLAAESK